MPKTKTSTKRSSKNQSKLKRTLSWFKPNSPAKKMLLFALVFGIAGGGYYAYNSRAASYSQYADKIHATVTASVFADTHSSKGTVYAWKLDRAYNRDMLGLSYGGAVYTDIFLGQPWSQFPASVNIPTKFCVTSRRPTNQPAGLVQPDVKLDGNWIGGDLYNEQPSTTYAKHCSIPRSIPGGTHIARVEVKNGPSAYWTDLFVYSISVEW